MCSCDTCCEKTEGQWLAMKIYRLMAVCAATMLFAMSSLCGCAGQVRLDEASPVVKDVQLSTTSNMTEGSQAVRISVMFDTQISASDDVASDISLLINGDKPDASVIKTEVCANATGLTIALSPSEGAAKGSGAGQFFALYQAQFSLTSSRDDGALAHVTGISGANAIIDQPIEGTLPSGLSISVDSQHVGNVADGVSAQTTFSVTSPALARVITWFSPDGGQTVLLKHNHNFAQADTQDCAADLAKVVNAQTELGITAQANGSQVTLTSSSVVDGQVIEPCVVEGVGVSGGQYDASAGMEA